MDSRLFFVFGDLFANVEAAGFQLREVNYLFLDVVKTIHAVK